MASLHRRPRSKYWRDAAGKLHMRSTKETRRERAWEIARGWEYVERNASNEAQVRRVMSGILHRNTGQALRTSTVREWFAEWLQGKEEATRARYLAVANDFFEYLGARGWVTPERCDAEGWRGLCQSNEGCQAQRQNHRTALASHQIRVQLRAQNASH